MNNRSKTGIYFLILVAGLVLGSIIGGEIARRMVMDTATPEKEFNRKDAETKERAISRDMISTGRRNAIVLAAERVEPSVVGIVVTQLQLVGTTEIYEDFFDLFFAPKLMPRLQEIQKMGSGFVISDSGLILTNFHVVRDAKKMFVNFPDGRQYEGTIVGADPWSDLAVISVKGKNFHTVLLGNSDDLLIGEWVIAIGNPFLTLFNDAQPTVTVGVVSALNRNLAPSENAYLLNMIQTDASINTGNSGGPLVNAQGEVIGINSHIFTGNRRNTGGSIGMGFAIPINRAKKVVQELVTYGYRRQPWTGISAQDIDRETALALGFDVTGGVLITGIQSRSPGARAGLQVNDIITKIGNKRITTREESSAIFTVEYFPGDTIAIEVLRGSQKIRSRLILEESKGK